MATSNIFPSWLAPRVLSVVRLVAGLLFLQHGLQKLIGIPPTDHAPAMFSLFWFGGIIETVTGALIAIGLFTRPAAFVASGTMAVAYWMVHAPQGPFPANNGGDASILFCFLFFYLIFAGAGPWSADQRKF
ncbi:DoxX family protein [Amorphus orientalis]|uniref:Oxidoreductase n=1 Tax=Amorphus orientalis TaxID=649198 RepID=A0AAE3VRQ8_9HYPH|nr:DoxX family protein [Amorphus orientalis]MDQ0316615.1 putative oxidoreductase [Amorphus orientalis]